MIFITRNENLYTENIEFICDYCQKKKAHREITIDMYSDLLKKDKWFHEKYHCDDSPTLKIFCCEQCKKKFERLYNKNNTNKTKKKVK